MKFAFLIMGNFDVKQDKASIHDGTVQVIGVSDLNEACVVAAELYKDGIKCIELCGAFGENGAREVINATQNKIPVGYVTHLPEQEEIYERTFAKK